MPELTSGTGGPLRRARDLYRRDGLGAALGSLGRYCADKARDMSENVHTTDLVRIETLVDDWRECHDYFPTSRATFARFLALAGVDPGEHVFCDIGSGLGRVLLMACEAGFGQVHGVEISDRLTAVARANLARRGHHADIRLADASCCDLPDQTSVFYLYNPCKGARLQALMDNLSRAAEGRARPLTLLFNNTAHVTDMEARIPGLACRTRFVAEHPCAIYEIAPAR